MTKAVAEGLPKMRIEEAAAERAAKVDTGETVIVGVNRYRLRGGRASRHPRGRQCQGPRRADRAAGEDAGGRDEAKARAALDALERARAATETCSHFASNAARVRCTLGEISDALERAFGRYAHQAGAGARHLWQGATTARWKEAVAGTAAVAERLGRKPRILVAKMGQDGHDRGANLVVVRVRRSGLRSDRRALVPDPARGGRTGGREATSTWSAPRSLAAGHKTLIPELIAALKECGRADIKVVAGGVIPPQDYAMLREAGVQAIFGPGTNLADAADEVLRLLGHNSPPVEEAAE